MKQSFNKSDIAIITTDIVEKTFDNKDAYLHGMIKIVKDNEQTQKRTYKVRTDLVGYENIELPKLNENNVQELDENDNPIFETKQILVWLEQKQDWSEQVFSYNEIDAFIEQLAPLIPSNLTRTQQDRFELNMMFLIKRQSVASWGISSDKWRVRIEEDLLK
ncbi:hypothetical protein [Tenacibaculum soleae]|uniref:hypothetical protein n=1 Tax=Tenacibaculum soleae TaxID=447689 RepID=UPI002301888F|nr:hypothetical protein [Tenacibaculum soleae]